jgi:hypothetical protein
MWTFPGNLSKKDKIAVKAITAGTPIKKIQFEPAPE